jgi:TonB family protein
MGLMLERRTRLGKYEVMEELGIGAMATVYKARNTEDGSPVAIKVPDRRLLSNVRALRQFKREGQALVRLRHPNIVRVHSVGEQDDLPYIVMDYVDGHTLSQQMQHKGRFSPEEVAEILLPIADALDYSHTEKTFHCDVKPGNIRLYRGRTPVLVDFGIVQTTDGTVWDEGKPIGSVWYMSPEQARGERASERSDQYSLAIVAYEMLTGNVPFDGDNPYAIVLQQRDGKPKIPADWNDSLRAVMQRVLDKDPQRRYSSCLEFVRALQAASREYISPVVVQPVVKMTPDDLWVTEPITTPSWQPERQRRETSSNTASVWQNEKQAQEASSSFNSASVRQNGGRGQELPSRKLEGPQKKALFAGAAIFCLFFLGLMVTVVLVRHRGAQAKPQAPLPNVRLNVPQSAPESNAKPGGPFKEGSTSADQAIDRTHIANAEVDAAKSKADEAKANAAARVKAAAMRVQAAKSEAGEQHSAELAKADAELAKAQAEAAKADARAARAEAEAAKIKADQEKASSAAAAVRSQAEAAKAEAELAKAEEKAKAEAAKAKAEAAKEQEAPTAAPVSPRRAPADLAPPSTPKSSEYVEAQLMKKVDPKYPSAASNRSYSIGVITIKFTIGKDGKVSNPKYVSGAMIFTDAALACVKQWQYSPAMRGGQPVESEKTITLTFNHE